MCFCMKGPCGRRSWWQMGLLSASAVSRLGFVLPLSWGRSGLSPRQWIPVCWSDKGKHLWHVREREGERERERRELKKKGLKHRPAPLTPEGSSSFACCALFTVEGERVDPSRSGRLSPTGLSSDRCPTRPGHPGRPSW